MARVLVLGGGAAGMVAAWRAAERGHAVTLVEGNARLAAKVRISGGGNCNLTHAGGVAELLRVFSKDQARFLKHAFHAFDGEELRALMRRNGLETRARENGCVFPVEQPGGARQVARVFENLLLECAVALRCGRRVTALEGRAPRMDAVRLEGGEHLDADVFILATGGASYPETGTRGEILAWLEALGVPVEPWFPALAPIPLRTPQPRWEGLALRHGRLCLLAGPGGRRLAEREGDVLFTKAGLSGPAALGLSQDAERARRTGSAWLAYAFTLLRPEEADLELRNEQGRNPHLAARTWLHKWIPERAVDASLQGAGVAVDQRLKDLTREARRTLVELLTGFPLGEVGPVSLDRGEVSAGGVALDAVDPRTMAVNGWENLRVCGELLDVNGPIGGYNLQAAFSTGFLAGTV